MTVIKDYILENTAGNLYWKNREGVYLGCNNNMLRLVQLESIDDLVGKTDRELLTHLLSDDKIRALEVVDQEVMSLGIEKTFEELGMDIHGAPAFYLSKKIPLRDSKGNIIGLMGTSIDITEQKKAALVKQDTTNNTLFIKDFILENAAGNLYWKNTKGAFLGCNNNTAELCHIDSPKDIVGKTNQDLFGDLLNEEQIQALEALDREVIEEGMEKTAEEVGVDKYNKIAYYLSRKMPLRDQHNKIIGLIGTSIDITQQKNAEAAKKVFLENMRHDIRTALAGVVGSASIIQRESAKNDGDQKIIHEYADNLVASAMALNTFLNEILETVRLGAGSFAVEKIPFDLKQCIERVININLAGAKQKGIELSLQYDQTLPRYLISDYKRLQGIFLELIGNALKFTENGSIHISVESLQSPSQEKLERLKISVTDTGIGIDPSQQDTIFTQFTRLSPSYQGVYSGSGLGLFTVKQFIQELKGVITVNSNLGKGSCFTCILPIEAAEPNAAAQLDTPPPLPLQILTQTYKHPSQETSEEATSRTSTANLTADASIKRLLLVEDNSIAANIAMDVLKHLNCLIDHAKNGEQAIRYSAEQRYDLILMDIGLPDISGLEVSKHIRLHQKERNHTTPIVALTAHVGADDQQQCLDVGMNAVLCKPIEARAVQQVLTTLILPV